MVIRAATFQTKHGQMENDGRFNNYLLFLYFKLL